MKTTDPLLSDLAFSLFIFLCDAEGAITVDDAQRLGRLIADPGWAKSPTMQAALVTLRTRYVSLWLHHQATRQRVDEAMIADRWRAARRSMPPSERPTFDEDVAAFAAELCEVESDSLNERTLTRRRQGLAAISHILRSESGAARQGQAASMGHSASPQGHRQAGVGDADVWTAGRIRLRCVGVTIEAPDVKTYAFRAVDGRRFAYKPGQAVTMEFPIEDRPLRRSYTISSTPSRPDVLTITVKRIAGGKVSHWLYDTLTVDMQLEAIGLHGKLTCADYPSDKLLLISAGSGVTPMMSMLRYLSDTWSTADIVFLNNVRTPQDVIFGPELTSLSAKLGPSLKLGIVPSQAVPGVSWNGPVGRFDERILRAFAPDFEEREVFVCGPAPYMAEVRATLKRVGHPEARYHEENFGGRGGSAAPKASPPPAKMAEPKSAKADKLPSAPARIALGKPSPAKARSVSADIPSATGSLKVVFQRSGVTALCSPDEALLDVAEKHGVELESACRVGACGACKVKTLRGSAVMGEQSVMDDDEIAQGYVLSCSARIRSDLLVDA